jgi:hypothetical protein
MKITMMLIGAAMTCSSCGEKNLGLGKNEPNLGIQFSDEVRSDGDIEFGKFEVINQGGMPIDVEMVIDASPPFCPTPGYEKLVDGKWIRLPLRYASAAIFSTIHPGQKVAFEAPITKLGKDKDSVFRLLIGGTNGGYFHSDPFRYPK